MPEETSGEEPMNSPQTTLFTDVNQLTVSQLHSMRCFLPWQRSRLLSYEQVREIAAKYMQSRIDRNIPYASLYDLIDGIKPHCAFDGLCPEPFVTPQTLEELLQKRDELDADIRFAMANAPVLLEPLPDQTPEGEFDPEEFA